jgi:hypothetical protein
MTRWSRQRVGRSYWITSSAVANSVSGMVRPSNFAALRLTTKVYVVSHEAESPYFSVTQAQSITSGLPVYNAGGGWQAVGAGTQIKYRFNPAWATYGIFEYDKLVGATASSPIVTDPAGTRNSTRPSADIATLSLRVRIIRFSHIYSNPRILITAIVLGEERKRINALAASCCVLRLTRPAAKTV